MKNFILRRLLQTLPMLLLASLIIFMLFAKTPGDFIDGNITLTAARADNARLREALEPFLRTFAAMKVAGLTPGDTFAVHPEAPIGDVLDGTHQPRVADLLALDCAALQQEHPHG